MSFVVFDIETTGLSSTQNDIIQFSYIMFDGNNNFVKAEDLYFYYEGMHWDQEVADKTHHFTLGFLKQHEAEFRANLLKMYSVLNRANVCGYNSNHFDCPFVKNWLSRFGLSDFEFGIKQDVMLGLRPVYKKARIKLVKLMEIMNFSADTVASVANLWFDKSQEQIAHNAMFDTAATALMALEGLRKGYLSFDFAVSSQVSVDADDFDYVGDSTEAKGTTSKRKLIAFTVSEGLHLHIDLSDGSYWYSDSVEPMATSYLVTADFVKESSDVYVANHRGCKVKIELGNDSHIVVESPYVTVDSRYTDIEPILESL